MLGLCSAAFHSASDCSESSASLAIILIYYIDLFTLFDQQSADSSAGMAAPMPMAWS